jgi:hypothetical protein
MIARAQVRALLCWCAGSGLWGWGLFGVTGLLGQYFEDEFGSNTSK